MTFTPNAPKPARQITPGQLLEVIQAGSIPTGSKSVGDNVHLVYMTGDTNFYLRGTPELHRLIRKYVP